MARSPIERFSAVFLIAGLVFFAFSFIASGLVPWLMMSKVPIQSLDDIAKNVPENFYKLAAEYPEEFKLHFGEANKESFKEAVELGRDIYIAEACWHCHSQQVRPVSNESQRFGKVSYASEYSNVLQMPQMMGTRRVGPDLIREAGKHSNDWHMAHFFKPVSVVPVSVMPEFTWFFDKSKRPNKKGLAMVTYMQWLGSWIKDSTDVMSQSIPAEHRK
jgi:cbb3-type cytochrome oxidase cytochrome c subunit